MEDNHTYIFVCDGYFVFTLVNNILGVTVMRVVGYDRNILPVSTENRQGFTNLVTVTFFMKG